MVELATQLRIEQLLSIDDEWAMRIFCFIDNHPEFSDYLWLAPLTRGAPVFEGQPSNVFEEICYCMTSAGVRADFGLQLFYKVRDHFKDNFPILEYEFRMPPSKIKYFESLVTKMLEHNLTPDTMTFEHFVSFKFLDIYGIGQSTVSFVSSKWGNDWTVLPLTDRGFINGIRKIYGPKTKKEIQTIADSWSDPQVAHGMVFGVHNYA